jgi:hypothetical protein
MSPPTPGRSRNRSPAGFQRRSAHSQASAPCAPDRRVHRRQGLDQATSQPPYCARRSGPASSTTSAGDGPDTSTVASHRRRVIRTCRHHRSGIRATDRLSQSGLIFGRAPRGSGCVPSRDVRAANGGGALSYPCFPGPALEAAEPGAARRIPGGRHRPRLQVSTYRCGRESQNATKLPLNLPPEQGGLRFCVRNKPLSWSPLMESNRRPSPYHGHPRGQAAAGRAR